jgi:hypothetical protein
LIGRKLDRDTASDFRKAADLIVIRGNLSRNISDVRNVEIVFKDGIGYDSLKLLASVKNQVGLH